MPQSPISYNSVTPAGKLAPTKLSNEGTLLTSDALLSKLNITTATVVKAGVGKIARVVVNTAGSTVGTISDVATTGAVAAANLIFNIPNTAGIYILEFPITTGLVVTPGTSQVVSITYI